MIIIIWKKKKMSHERVYERKVSWACTVVSPKIIDEENYFCHSKGYSLPPRNNQNILCDISPGCRKKWVIIEQFSPHVRGLGYIIVGCKWLLFQSMVCHVTNFNWPLDCQIAYKWKASTFFITHTFQCPLHRTRIWAFM
jgi:hypothetical protein